MTGWPEDPKDLPKCIRHYWSCRDELSVDNGLVVKGDRIIIPESMQQETLAKIHAGHQGVNKCQLRAKVCVYWPGINKDIEQLVGKCVVCQTHQRKQSHEPLLPHEIPQRPWQTVGTDLFHFDNADYLIIADYYSKATFVRRVSGQCSSAAVITLTKQIFSEQGIPTKVISDNGPQYDSREYHKFSQDWEIDHVTSSPRYPRSNGFIERMIQTVKLTLTKAKQSNVDPYLALLCLRTTPIDSALPSPAELLNGRKLKDNLPSKIRHNRHDKDDVYARLAQRQDKQKEYHDRDGMRKLSSLVPGQHVTVQDHHTGKWTPAVVKDACPEPRSFIVQTPTGQSLRRNRVHIRNTEPMRKTLRFADPPVASVHTPSLNPHAPKSILRKTGSKSTDQKQHSDNNNSITNLPAVATEPYRTRSGRVVKKPQRLIET
ncbi:uncharacterized protein K02A2.6-like [Patiria miniata]|uniref:Integrase catalytic domain-containing protein n=1 Tax=Patiria miniata TaxID=46514 RepID=A0A914BB38_PATMI|nr:uncharacterized protein K02A2.6-like [Patiria miniata]